MACVNVGAGWKEVTADEHLKDAGLADKWRWWMRRSSDAHLDSESSDAPTSSGGGCGARLKQESCRRAGEGGVGDAADGEVEDGDRAKP